MLEKIVMLYYDILPLIITIYQIKYRFVKDIMKITTAFNIEHWPDKLDNYHVNYDLQTWWKQVSGEDYVQNRIVFWGCIFCVEKSLIYRRPLSFYQKLHGYFTKHRNPVETHFVERTWANIFQIGLSVDIDR